MTTLLLTSAGISNASIHDALVDQLGKPIAESSALCIPTAAHAMPGGAEIVYRVINGSVPTPLCELGWKSLGVLELTALPSIDEDHWLPMLREADALLVAGGDALDHEDLPENSMADAERWAAGVPVPGYAIDDQTAIMVTDGTVEVISEGHWKLFTPPDELYA